MPTQLLSIGYPQTLLQNVVYALPIVECTLYCDTATPTLLQSSDLAFGTSAAITLTAGVSTVTGGFLKSTAGNAVVLLKRD